MIVSPKRTAKGSPPRASEPAEPHHEPTLVSLPDVVDRDLLSNPADSQGELAPTRLVQKRLEAGVSIEVGLDGLLAPAR